MGKLGKGLLVLLLAMVCLCGCSFVESERVKIEDLDFTVLGEEKIPQELLTLIEERKAEPFKLTYNDQVSLYIVIGYGEQKTGGYSIAVDELYLAEDAIYVSTSLLGPDTEQETETASYPYIVIKTDYLDETVIFE